MTDGWESRCWFFRLLFPFMGRAAVALAPKPNLILRVRSFESVGMGFDKFLCKNTPKNASLSYSKICFSIGKYLKYLRFRRHFFVDFCPFIRKPTGHQKRWEVTKCQSGNWGGGILPPPPSGNSTGKNRDRREAKTRISEATLHLRQSR